MSPPRQIYYSLLLPSTDLQVNTSSKPPEACQYYRLPCHHLAIYIILYYNLLQIYRSTRRQNLLKDIITTGHHVTTSPNILFSTTTFYRSTGQHVVKTLRIMPVLQVTMSPPRHIYYSLLLPTTDLQVNTSSKPSESCQYYRSPCHHLAIYLILHYYLLQVYRSTRRQNLHNYTLLQVTMSPHRHVSYSLLLPTTCLQVNTSSKPFRFTPIPQVIMAPPRHKSHSLTFTPTTHSTTPDHYATTSPYPFSYYRSTFPQNPTHIPILQVTLSYSILPYIFYATMSYKSRAHLVYDIYIQYILFIYNILYRYMNLYILLYYLYINTSFN